MPDKSQNHRLTAALKYAAKRSPQIAAKAARTRFTSATAKAANAVRHATRKPQSATLRVEADVPALVRIWPTRERVARTSAAIRAAVAASGASNVRVDTTPTTPSDGNNRS